MEYEVKKGDGWYRIAKNLGVNVNDLLQANNAKLDTMLQPGQKLQTSKKLVAKPKSTWEGSAVNDWVNQQINKNTQLISKSEANIQKDSAARKNKVYQGQPDKTYQEMQSKDNIQALQQQLRSLGYDIGKTGADGIMGNSTKTALANAEKDGYTLQGQKLVKKVSTNQPQKSQPQKSEGSFFHGIMSKWANTPVNPEDPLGNILRAFYKGAYQGTEEDARRLGYENYQPQGSFRAYPVSYETEGDHASIQDRAQAQLDQYGITSEQTQDKSRFQKWQYQYLPGYGYNVLHLLENYNEGTPVADSRTGKAVYLDRNPEDSWAYQYGHQAANASGKGMKYFFGNMSHAREDYRNLYYGYPQQHNTLSINKDVKAKNSGEFRDGYAYVQKSYDPISLSSNLQPGETKNVVGGQFNNFTIGKTADGEQWYIDDWDLIGDDYLQMGRPFEIYNRR